MALESPISMVAPQDFSKNVPIEIHPELRQKQFDLLHSLLRELQRGLTNGTAAVAGLFLLAIGWFVSLKETAPFLREHPRFIPVVALTPVLAALLYSYAAWLIHKRSQNVAACVRRMDLMPSAIYENRVITRGQFLIFAGGVIFLSVVLAFCIDFAAHSVPQGDDDSDSEEVIMQVHLTRPHGASVFCPGLSRTHADG